MDKEMAQFQADLLASVQQMKKGRAAKETRVPVSEMVEARHRVKLSQAKFAKLMGVSPRTLQSWEQGKRQPSGAAQTLMRVAMLHPEALRDI